MDNVVYLTWKDVYRRIATKLPVAKCYGVPRGGAIVAGILGNAVDRIEDASYVVDDIIDSGKTQERMLAMLPKEVQFIALFNKQEEKELQGKWVVFPWEGDPEDDIQDTIVRQLEFIGENPAREGLKETPNRIAKSWCKLYGGYSQNIQDVCTTFDKENYTGMILAKDIEMYSTCEHHMLPFIGKCHIAYVPYKKVIGISKLARIMEIFSRRLQIQERLTDQIADAVMELLHPRGVAVKIEAEHLCMRARGVEKQNSIMHTTSLRGVFLDKIETRNEFLGAIK